MKDNDAGRLQIGDVNVVIGVHCQPRRQAQALVAITADLPICALACIENVHCANRSTSMRSARPRFVVALSAIPSQNDKKSSATIAGCRSHSPREAKLAGPEQAIPRAHHPHDHRIRIRRRKKFWRRPSWWSTVGRSIIIAMLAVIVLFSMYLVWAGIITRPP